MTWFLVYLLVGLFTSWASLMSGNKRNGWQVEIIAILTWPLMFVLAFVAAWREMRGNGTTP